MTETKNRMLNTSLWLSKFVSGLDPNGKLLFCFLLSSPFTNEAGIYEIPILMITAFTGLSDPEIEKQFKIFEDRKKIYYYDGFVIIVNHTKHQKLNPNWIKSIQGRIRQVESRLKDCEGYKLYKEVFNKVKEEQHGRAGKAKSEIESLSGIDN